MGKKDEEVTRRYGYQLRKNGHYVCASFYSVPKMLKYIEEHPGITEIIQYTYIYTDRGVSRRIRERGIPLDEVVELQHVGYQIVMPGNVVLEEEIFHFNDACRKANEVGAEGLLETTRFFDIKGNEIFSEHPQKPWSAYLLTGEVVLSDKLPMIAAKQPLIYCKEPKEEADISRCVVTKSGLVAFLGRYAKPLNAYCSM